MAKGQMNEVDARYLPLLRDGHYLLLFGPQSRLHRGDGVFVRAIKRQTTWWWAYNGWIDRVYEADHCRWVITEKGLEALAQYEAKKAGRDARNLLKGESNGAL